MGDKPYYDVCGRSVIAYDIINKRVIRGLKSMEKNKSAKIKSWKLTLILFV